MGLKINKPVLEVFMHKYNLLHFKHMHVYILYFSKITAFEKKKVPETIALQ